MVELPYQVLMPNLIERFSDVQQDTSGKVATVTALDRVVYHAKELVVEWSRVLLNQCFSGRSRSS